MSRQDYIDILVGMGYRRDEIQDLSTEQLLGLIKAITQTS